MAFNINEMAASAYNIIQNLQEQAVEMVGMDALYFRATPNANSEDAVVFQEYTLYNVEDCGQKLKIVLSDNNYQGGDYTVGLFGIEYQAIPELQMLISEWQAHYPADTQPQKNDIVYIGMLHKLFEVASSTIVYTAGERPLYFKLALQKYSPQASRRESEDLRSSIEEMTVTQEDLFGETISQEVADAVVEVETAYNTTSTVDPMKDFDIHSVVYDELFGPSGVRISNAYYDMKTATQNVVYHTPASYKMESETPNWLFSCWFRSTSEVKKKEYAVRKLTYMSQDAKYWYFRIATPLKLKAGDNVTITKGTLLSATGDIIEMDCEVVPVMRVPLAQMQLLERRLPDWHKQGPFKIRKTSGICLLRSDNETISIDAYPDRSVISLRFGSFMKDVILKEGTQFNNWTYIMVGFKPNGCNVFIEKLYCDANSRFVTEDLYSGELKANVKKPGDFSFKSLGIPSMGSSMEIRNIRLYESEYEMTDEIARRDALTEVTENASKLIVVDAPNVAQKGDFYSPAR